MRELIASVASILNDLETLKLLEKKNLDTSVEMDANTHKYVLIVSIQSDDDILSFYLEIFRLVRLLSLKKLVGLNSKKKLFQALESTRKLYTMIPIY